MSADESQSLILGNGRQLDLIPGTELDEAGLPPEAYADAESRGRFTGGRLFLQNPRVYRAVVRLLGRGEHYDVIAETLEVSKQTITGVALRERIPIETIRERVGRLGMEVANMSLEMIYEILADPANRAQFTPRMLKDLAVVFGIGVTNSQLLTGGATARIEAADTTRPGHDDYERMLREMTNVTPPATGLAAGNPGAKEGDVIEVNATPKATGNDSQQAQPTQTK